MKNLSRFLQYNNAVPIVLSVLVLGGGSVFAATNPDAVLSQEHTVLSVDNTYIATKDLSSWSPVVNMYGRMSSRIIPSRYRRPTWVIAISVCT